MEIDLAAVEAPIEAVRSQVCVVGAGIAGLVLARKLMQRGIDVVVLEAGGRELDASAQRLFAEAQLKSQARAATSEGRVRAFGGTSLVWGGQLLGMSREDAAEWPIAWEEIASFSLEAERLLEVDELPFEGADFFAAAQKALPPLLAEMDGMDARISKWLPHSRRNLASTFGRELLAHPKVRVYLHAQATELLLAASRDRIEAVLVRGAGGAMFRFEAQQFVIAAGTVETSRLLLASRSVAPEGVGNTHDQVGRNFHDHVTLTAATITGAARERVLRELRPWVFEGIVHSMKLQASRALRRRLGMNPILAHLAIEESEGSGVAVVRELLAGSQRGELSRAFAKNALRVPGAAVEAVRLAMEAKLRHRRFISDHAAVKLQFNVAQDVPSCSRISLGSELDASGVPQALVDWRVSDREMDSLRKFAVYLKGRFDAAGLDGVEWVRELFEPGAALPELDDARHAMGGACMGFDPRSSVVDAELSVYGIANLSIASAATFPAGSAQLPTLTLMALTLRLGERIAERLHSCRQLH